MLEDRAGNIWLATARGLNKATVDAKSLTHTWLGLTMTNSFIRFGYFLNLCLEKVVIILRLRLLISSLCVESKSKKASLPVFISLLSISGFRSRYSFLPPSRG
ncbi:hypothetical protein [Cesiribacter sp. SM1]|uniref:hypothetical protein n=1 Tax=Cesiribacter sp. SM1 TaxID=2861196 RepID=UPI001CD50AC5